MDNPCTTLSADFIHSLHTGHVLVMHLVTIAVFRYNWLFFIEKYKLSTGSKALNNNNNLIISNIY